MESHGQMYQDKVSNYTRGRIGYAPQVSELIAALAPSAGATVADMGAGTGIFSQALLELGFTVYAVESSSAMLDAAQAHLGDQAGFHAIAATAEQSGLPENTIDLVTAASAFHWFHTQAFQAECRRILKPGGRVFLLVNRRRDDDEFAREHHMLCMRFCRAFAGLHQGADKTDAAAASFFPNGFARECFPFELRYTAERFFERCLSSSYSPGKNEPNYSEYCDALQAMIDRYAVDGWIIAPNDTVVWHGQF